MVPMNCIKEILRPGSTDIAAPHHPEPGGVDGLGSFVGPITIPRTRQSVYQVYGNPGSAKSPLKKWQRQNLMIAKKLPGLWNKGRGRLCVHELVEPYLREALERAEAAGCLATVRRLGCYTHRHQRHDPRRPLSYHSWGIAIDIDPAQNRARKFAKGLAPKPFSDDWVSWWPEGISSQLVNCFESVGWTWGGRWSQFVDPMHMEMVGD